MRPIIKISAWAPVLLLATSPSIARAAPSVDTAKEQSNEAARDASNCALHRGAAETNLVPCGKLQLRQAKYEPGCRRVNVGPRNAEAKFCRSVPAGATMADASR